MQEDIYNQDAINMFRQLAQENNGFHSEKLLPQNDHTDLDAKFIAKYLSKNSVWLDIGSGSGQIIKRLYDKVKLVNCVEPVAEYAQQIIRADNVNVFNGKFSEFRCEHKFDIVSAFGTMQFFSYEEALQVYQKVATLLKKISDQTQGIFLIKNQFGLKERVVVDRFSEELNRHYVSEYRTLDEEKSMLEKVGFSEFEVVDIYESHMNRFNNTHYYALVAKLLK